MLKEILLEALSTNMTIDELLTKPEFRMGMTEVLVEEMGEDVQIYMNIDPYLCSILFIGGIMEGTDNPITPRQEIIDENHLFLELSKILVFKTHKESLRTFLKYKQEFTQILISGFYYGQECVLKKKRK